jgi:hypothetical protein
VEVKKLAARSGSMGRRRRGNHPTACAWPCCFGNTTKGAAGGNEEGREGREIIVSTGINQTHLPS